MKKIKRIYYKFKLARRFSQIRRLSYLSQALLMVESEISENTKTDLNNLNLQRQNVQRKAEELISGLVSVCSGCRGYCCLRSYHHHSVLEYWLRKYSEFPLKNYGFELFEPLYLSILRNKLNIGTNPMHRVPEKGCHYMTEKGCSLPLSERPIKCVAFTCQNLRNAMNKEIAIEYSKVNENLYRICMLTFDVLKREAGIHRFYGKLSVFMRF